MAAKITCDSCGEPIHTNSNERKFRIDFFAPKEARGFDVCENCWMRLRKEIKAV